MQEIIAQLIGFVATFFSIISFQMNSHKKIITCQASANFLFAIHLFMLNAPTGVVLHSIAFIRNLIFYHRDKKWASGAVWPVVFSILFVVSGILSWQGYLSLLPTIAMVLNTLTFSCTKPKIIRSTILLSSPLWLIYNALSRSYPGVINESIVICSTIIGMFRYDFKRKDREA